MPSALFELLRPSAPWGDYGDILFHGMSLHLPRRDGQIQLERTGPFVPPVSFPGFDDIVVTDEFRAAFEQAGFTGATFRPVIKRHITRVDWDQWNKGSAEPVFYPEEGEPEGYVLDKPHDEALSDAIGALWELVPTTVPGLRKRGGQVDHDKHPGCDLCVASEYGASVILTSRLADWMERTFAEWVRVERV